MTFSTKNFFPVHLQDWGLVILRIIIGWHLLYEGVVKVMEPGWTSEAFLANSRGVFSGLFIRMASQPVILEIVDFLNIWGLILIGLGLFLGLFARLAVYAGIFLLFFYYIAFPPFQGGSFGMPQEGHYLIVNKTFIEMVALIVLALFPKTLNIGVGALMGKFFSRVSFARRGAVQNGSEVLHKRRSLLKNLTFLPFLGGFGWAFATNRKYTQLDAFTGSTITLNQRQITEIDGKMPMGVLFEGKQPVSRLILGTNIFSGNAHARDLVYVNSLFRAYNTEKKIIETYMIAERSGINLAYMTPLLRQYMRIYGSSFQTWVNVSPTKDDIYGPVDRAIDMGVDYIYIQGAACDRRVYEGNVDVLAKCIDYIKQQGYPAGLGAHTIQALWACEEAGIDPDFYYKTLHHDNYWSAHPRENRFPFLWSSNISPNHGEFHDNMWCPFPDETIEFIQRVNKPVVGFKVLAGGALHPEDGFNFAFSNGADFIDVGMFDYQIVDDVIHTIDAVGKNQNRSRKWYG